MTYPRAHLVDQQNGGTYLCTSRCVRRAWLCGVDPLSGESFEHRRAWIENRLLALSSIFAIDLHAYAVMSNHYHAVVHVDPRRVDSWTDEQVTQRWARLRVLNRRTDTNTSPPTLVLNQERLVEIRRRLGSLSSFMGNLNEFIGRQSNREDNITGRFWQGRFDSQALLDDTAAIAGMTYVDLNPVRAGITIDLAEAVHTSIARRIARQHDQPSTGLSALSTLGLSLSHYIELLQWTAAAHNAEPPPPQPGAARALQHLGYQPQRWLARVNAQRHRYRAYGARAILKRYAESLGQQWVQGMRSLP